MKTQLEWTNGALISTAKYGAIEYTASDQVAYFNCGESCWQNRLYAEFGRGNFKKLCQSHHDAICEQVEMAKALIFDNCTVIYRSSNSLEYPIEHVPGIKDTRLFIEGTLSQLKPLQEPPR